MIKVVIVAVLNVAGDVDASVVAVPGDDVVDDDDVAGVVFVVADDAGTDVAVDDAGVDCVAGLYDAFVSVAVDCYTIDDGRVRD